MIQVEDLRWTLLTHRMDSKWRVAMSTRQRVPLLEKSGYWATSAGWYKCSARWREFMHLYLSRGVN